MISTETVKLLQKFMQDQDSYLPASKTTLEALSTKTLVQLVGPTASGKSTLMDAVEEYFEDFSVVGTGTTRPPRAGDHPTRYHYIEHTDESLPELFKKIENKELIQYYVTPKPPYYVYWSELADYESVNNIGDYFSSVIDSFSQYGFRRVLPVSIVREVEPWLDSVNQRFPVGHPDRLARLEEAASSISWSLSQHNSTHVWLIISENDSQANIQQLRSIVNGSVQSSDLAIVMARECLESIRQLIAHEAV